MKMRKLFAGIAAAATLLGGMALGATSAQADEPQATTPLLQVNNAQEGHTYTPYMFATFANAGNGTVEVDTVAAWKDAVAEAADAADNATANSVSAEYANNPAAYVATFNAEQLRKFAEELAKTNPLPAADGAGLTVAANQAGTTQPVAVNGEALSPAQIMVKLNELGRKHGIGRVDMVENRFVGIKSRGVYETPGGAILYKAINVLETITLDKESSHFKAQLAQKYADIVYNGQWFTPLREALDAFADSLEKTVTGDEVYGGRISRSVSRMEHDEQTGMTAEFAGQFVARRATQKRAKLICTMGHKYALFVFLMRILPTGLATRIVGRIYAS